MAATTQKPTDYLREHILWGFQQDSVGVRLRVLMGVGKLIWATDFPHQESEYPHSHTSSTRTSRRSADETYQMVAEMSSVLPPGDSPD